MKKPRPVSRRRNQTTLATLALHLSVDGRALTLLGRVLTVLLLVLQVVLVVLELLKHR